MFINSRQTEAFFSSSYLQLQNQSDPLEQAWSFSQFKEVL